MEEENNNIFEENQDAKTEFPIAEEFLEPTDKFKLFDLEKDFDVTIDDQKEIQEQVAKEQEERLEGVDRGFLESLGDVAEFEKEVTQRISDLEKEKFDNKMNYISSLAGDTVSSEGLNFNPVADPVGFVKNILLKYDLSRSANFGNRKKKFLETYPEGEYTRIKVPFSDNDTEFLEIFKLNKNDEGYKMISPYGRDAGEIPQILGVIKPEELTAEIVSLFGSGKASALNKFLRVLVGARIGIEAADITEALRGYGEREYEDGFPTAIEFVEGLFTDMDQNTQALFGATFYSLGDLAVKYATGKIRFGEIEGADEIVAAAERLGVEPLVFAQLAANPILRKTFFQAGDFSGVPGSKTRGQLDSLLQKFDEMANKQDLKPIDLLLANETIEKEMAALIKNAGADNQAQMLMKDLLPQLAQKYNANVIKLNKKLSNDVLDAATDASIDLFDLKKTSSQIRNTLQSGTFYTGKVDKVTGKKIKAGVNIIPESVDNLLRDINKLENALNSGGKGNKAQFDKSFNALLNIRYKAAELLRSNDKAENYAGREILNKIDNIFNNKGGLIDGDELFLTNMRLLQNNMLHSDAVLNTSWARGLMTGTMDPDSWVDLVVNPNNKIKLNVLKQIIEGPETPKEISDYALKTIRKSFITKLLNDPDNLSKNLDEWITKDKDTLIYMLGDAAEAKIKKLYNVSRVNDQLSKSVFKEALIKQGEDFEIVAEIIKKAKGDVGVGISKELDELIRVGGPDFVESVRAGIIENVLETSVKAATEGKIGKVLDIGILQKQIKELTDNPYLTKFFSEADLQNFADIDLYVSRLGEAGDVGGPMAAGSLRAKVAESIFNPFTLVDVGLTIVRYDILSRILASPATVKTLRQYQDGLLNSRTLDGIILSIGNLAKPRAEGDTPFVFEEFMDPSMNLIEESENQQDQPSEDQVSNQAAGQVPVQVPTSVVPGSAISSAQVVLPPLPTMGNQTANAPRAQQAFPFDPIFAAMGGSITNQGIMNTSRGRQMVV
mgnify:FL=1